MTHLYHRDIGIPRELQHDLPYGVLFYSKHALAEARKDMLVQLPEELPAQFNVVEIEALDGVASKWTLCLNYPTYDLFMVVLKDGFVKTVWVCEPSMPKPLNWGNYARP